MSHRLHAGDRQRPYVLRGKHGEQPRRGLGGSLLAAGRAWAGSAEFMRRVHVGAAVVPSDLDAAIFQPTKCSRDRRC